MELKPHKDMVRKAERNMGYAIRVGRQVPTNSANLAYVSSKAVSPEENILLEDVSYQIEENGLSNYTEKEYIVYPNKNYQLETNTGLTKFPTDAISITDEFTIKKNRQDTPKPVFYRMEMSGRFDLRSSQVLPYEGGFSSQEEQEAVSFEAVQPDKREELAYIGNAIRIEANDGVIKPTDAYKIILLREEGFIYRIVVMTNFRNLDGLTYKVIYPNYDRNRGVSDLKEEVLKAYPFFDEVTNAQFEQAVKDMEKSPDVYKHLKAYTVIQDGNQYSFKATSDLLIANYETRTPQFAKHRVEAKLRTKLSETNPGKLNIGFYFVHGAAGVENLSSIGKAINEHKMLPSYLELVNPHPIEDGLLKTDVNYWIINLDMPNHHYEDFDIIVITGYGKMNVSMYKEKIESYLQNGGNIIVENAGSGTNVLDFTSSYGNTFISDIQFSVSSAEYGIRQFPKETLYGNRLFPINDPTSLGYDEVSPAIVFGRNESAGDWTSIVKHLNGGPSIIKKEVNERGALIISNAGLFRSFYHNADQSVKFILNLLMVHAEEQWIFTPWRNEFIYHRDNLFQQEYKVNNSDSYINDRNDYNANEIVAKKILHSNMKDYVKIYSKPSFYNAVGTYHHNVQGDKELPIGNPNFESGSLDATGMPITKWTDTKADAIPSWNTKKLAGSTVSFSHESAVSLFGVRQISVDCTNASNGTHSYWESEDLYLSVDDYKITAWLSVKGVSGTTTGGAKVGIYTLTGEKIATSIDISGTKDKVKVETTFRINQSQLVKIRLGFVDGNGYGKASFDNISLKTIGAVRGVPSNEGEKQIYLFSIKPNATTLDIESEGFESANITIANPEVPYSFTITPFIHLWTSLGVDSTTGLEIGVFARETGKPIMYKGTVKKSEGLVNLGHLHTLLPGIPSGRDWYDQNRVFFKIELGDESQAENTLLNLKLYDRKTGEEWYYSDELVIGYRDIFGATIDPSFVLHVQTEYETIRASKRNFGLKMMDNRRIYSEIPQTKDPKENWYLRIHNGAFTKKELSYKEWMELFSHADKDTLEQYKNRVMKQETYEVKEYRSQIFNPSIGIMTVENELEYLNPGTVKAPHNNLQLLQGAVKREQLRPESYSVITGTWLKAENENWLRNDKVHIYLDELNNGNAIEIFEQYPMEIDFDRGLIFFPNKNIQGKVYADYEYRNYHVYKRLYKNTKMVNDLLANKRHDTKTREVILYGSKENWLTRPVPILKTTKGKATANNTIPSTNYRIDYEKGAVIFKYDPTSAIYADYGYYDNEELSVKDIDIQNGLFFLDGKVSFKDELYAKYSYYEDFYEYKGYYNEEQRTFFHLDLNPSVGHYSTLPMTTYMSGAKKAEYKLVPSSQLLNKIIHVYLIPKSQGGYSIRHCFSLEEWRNLQSSNPMALLIAKIQIREHTRVEDTVVMDARSRGGGLSEGLSVKEIDKRVKGKQRYWDISNWDGKAFYRNGVLVITLPKTILREYGGTLSDEYVRESIDKHVAFGTYYILEWK